jgi:predicted RNA binding protein YcfA (HicA-like mRNA interferase family)
LNWPAVKAGRLLAALLRSGWKVERQSGSHRVLRHPERGEYIFAFHDGDEIGPVMVGKVAKKTGLTRGDL